MTVRAESNTGVSQRDTYAIVWQLTGHAARSLEQAAALLDEIGQGLPPAEQALAYTAALDAVRECWDAIAAIRDRLPS